MKLAYFSGCKIPFYMKDYDLSFKAVMHHLGIELVELPFNCCGYPVRGDSFEISILSAIKNFAIAQKHDLDMITPCKCCFGQFKHAQFWYKTQPALKEKIDDLLALENLLWEGHTKVKHLLSFLTHDIGLEKLGKQIQKRLPPRNVVVQYGCHALRPFSVTGFDNPFVPKIFEQLLGLTGVKVIDWSKSTECCGNPILKSNQELSLKILQNKFNAAQKAGADYICTACTHCQMQYEMVKSDNTINNQNLTTLLYTQILGAALGVSEKKLSETGRLPEDLFKDE
ncbi:MAG: CoB--CoM heterodisulfide reductase iron-sulfur subunit B family protein [Desulfobacula sp.]|nr:CoB--CoM heterodisulfide reductase iron-sulfur subunit B family protein [Desulfobacula sp.]